MSIYERLQKIIEKGLYDKVSLINNLPIYEELKAITEDEKNELVELMNKNPSTENSIQDSFDNNIYLLLERQIDKQVYPFSQITEMVINLNITKTIDNYQLLTLSNLIKEKYSTEFITEDNDNTEINNKGDN